MRWIIRLVGLVLIVAVVAVASVLMLPGDRIARIAADQIAAITGREVTMQGETTVSFWPVLGVSTGAITIANPDWAGEAAMFRADSLKIGVEPQALFGGDVRITGLEATAPEVILVRAADGRVNWELGVEGVAPSGQSDGGAPARSSRLALTLDRALVRNASLTYDDRMTGRSMVIKGVDFDLRWPDYEGTARFEAALSPAGETLRIEGQLDRVGHFIAGGVSDMAATLKAPSGKVSFAGRAGATPEAAGRLEAEIADIPAFLASLGLGAAELPDGLGRSLAVSAEASLTRDLRLSLRDTALQLERNRLTGAADIQLGGSKPVVNMQLRAGALDLSRMGGGGAGSSAAGAGGSDRNVVQDGWSKRPIDASVLALVDGEFALVADSVDLGDLKLGKTRTLARLDRARLVFELREVRAYDGLVTGQFVMNNRSGLSVGGKIAAGGINLQRFLGDAMDITRIAGAADGEISFLGVGQSVHAIMTSLKGDGAFRTGQGAIAGFDLEQLMRTGKGSGGQTPFEALQGTFRIEKGNLFNNDLSVNLPRSRAAGEGRVGLGARDIDYLFTPVFLDDGGGRGIAVPVRIRGPWADPKVTPDLEKAIDLNLAEEKKELEQKARDEVQRALEKELGVNVEEGQSVEDALEKKLEEGVKKKLKKLFD